MGGLQRQTPGHIHVYEPNQHTAELTASQLLICKRLAFERMPFELSRAVCANSGGTWGAGMGCHGDPPSADGACRPDSPPELCYCTLRHYWGCVFPPHALEEMMTVQVRRSHGYYNEVRCAVDRGNDGPQCQ